MTVINFEIGNNEDWLQGLLAIDSDSAALNLSTAQIRMDVEDRTGAKLLSLSGGNGITVTDPAQGLFQIDVDAAQMAALAPGIYAYDLLIEVNGQRYAVARGTLTVREGITTWTA